MADPRNGERPRKDGGKPSVTGDLASRIARARTETPGASAARQVRQSEVTGAGRGFRLASEFVAAVVVGAALGWGLDAVLPTRPWGMVILLILGFAAGVLNIVRATAELNAETAVPPGTPARPDDDDE